jgi:hypothetical protein
MYFYITGIFEGREVVITTGIQELELLRVNPVLQTHRFSIRTRLLRVLQEVQLVNEPEQVRQEASHCRQD